jgi:hypothetical protein
VGVVVTGVLLGALLADAHGAAAGVNAWTSTGPTGGYARTIAIDPASPSTVYAGTKRSSSTGSTPTRRRGTTA